jgi:hypothetical protein
LPKRILGLKHKAGASDPNVDGNAHEAKNSRKTEGNVPLKVEGKRQPELMDWPIAAACHEINFLLRNSKLLLPQTKIYFNSILLPELTASVILWSEFLTANLEDLGSIPGATKYSA